jgi:uncharacterized membrane protein
MKNSGLILFSIVTIAALSGASYWAGHSLPADAQLPMHWNAAGEIDRYGDKWTALMMPPLLAAVMGLVMWGIGQIEPRQNNLASGQGLFRVAWVGGLGLSVVIEVMLLSTVFHWGLSPLGLIFGAFGLLFIAMGDQFGKTRPMYMVGIRTPWTLADPEVWTATHRFGGKLIALAGLVWLISAVFGWVNVMTLPILIGVMLVASFVPIVYSYLLWRRQHRNG